jgi:glyoxylate reductase
MSHPRVFVARKLPGTALERLAAQTDMRLWEEELPPPRERLLDEARESEGLLMLLTDRVDEELLGLAPRLRGVSNMAVGFDNIDVPACTARGVLVGNTPGVLTDTTADFAFALLMAAARRVVEGDAFVRAGRWQTWDPGLLLGQDVHGATIGIAGMGQIGQAVARRAQGFEMRILYTDEIPRPEIEAQTGARRVDLETLLRESDFVTLHVPLTTETRHLIDAERLGWMKPSAILVNTSRGPVVDQRALAEALRRPPGDGGAGRDRPSRSRWTPPRPAERADRAAHRQRLRATREKMAEMAVDNLLAALQGELPPNCVNPEALGRQR